ncbi:unnamed protein product, partial [Amoebophrya sp. A120]|eukprot:GSA120T00022309001.1
MQQLQRDLAGTTSADPNQDEAMMTSEQRLLQHQLLQQQQQQYMQQYHQSDQPPQPMQQNLTSTVIDGAPAPAPNGPSALVPQAAVSLQQQQSLLMMNPLMLRPSAVQQQDDDDDKLSVHSHRSGKSAYSAYKTRSRDSLPALAEASPYGGGATRNRRPGSASKSTTTRTTPPPDLLLQQQQAQISAQHQQHLQRGLAQLEQDHSPYGGPQHQQDAVMQDLQNQQTALSDQQLLHMQTQGLTAEQIQQYQAHLDASQQRLQPSQFNSAPPVLFHTEPPRRHYRPQHGARGDDASSFASDDFDALRNSDSVGEAGDPTGSSSPSPEQGGFGFGPGQQPQAFTGHLVPPLQLSAARGTVIDNYTDDQRGPHVDTARSSAASSGFAPSSAGGGGLVSVSRRGSLAGVEGTMIGHGEDGALAPTAPGGGGLVPQPRAKSWKELHVEARPAPAHIVVFDWDDTLLPTWYIGNVVLPCVTGLKFCSMNSDYKLDPTDDFYDGLNDHAQLILTIIRTALNLTPHVFIVTLGKTGWVSRSAAQRLPGFTETTLTEMGVNVYYAREYLSRREAMLCQQEEGCDPFMVAKRNAFKKVMKVVVKSQEKLWKKAHKDAV